MKHVKTLNTQTMNSNLKRADAESARHLVSLLVKTSCTVGNQTYEQKK